MTSRFGRPEKFRSWGRIEKFEGPIAHPRFAGDLPEIFADPQRPKTILGVGAGRSYGDSGLNLEGGLVDMTGLNRIIQIDKHGLVLQAQAGLTLDAALKRLTPMGLFLPVVPGTRFVTLGGAVANDIHGKNHAANGAFGRWVRRIELNRSDRGQIQLAPGDPDGLFAATIGGLGQTGLISWVEIGLKAIETTDLMVQDAPFDTLDEYYKLMLDHSDADYRVAWIDCARPGRGIFSHARHLMRGELAPERSPSRFTVPFDMPGILINGLTTAAFNAVYRATKRSTSAPRRMHYSKFHFPLDGIGDWNRLYGVRGFRQYQCVLPHVSAREAAMEILTTVKKSGDGSILAVLKQFGGLASPGLLSFPREGATLALDFRDRGQKSHTLLNRLDAIVLDAGGRIYAAKDGRVSARTFQRMYPNWAELEAKRDPAIRSTFWKRVSA